MIIYKATNIVNNKIYIGLTIQEFEERKRKHLNDAKIVKYEKIVFHRALRKYGEENFIWEVIDHAESEEELYEKEKFWIAHYNTFIHAENSNGYNMTLGGEGKSGYRHSEESKAKMRESTIGKYAGELHPLYGKQHKPETIEKIRQAMYNREVTDEMREQLRIAREARGEPKPKSEETKAKISASKKGQGNKAVIQLTLDGEFVSRHDSAKDGAESVNGVATSITATIRGRQKSAYGFKWMYAEDYEC